MVNALVQRDVSVVCIDLDRSKVAAAFERFGKAVLPLKGDVADSASIRSAIEHGVQHFGRIDICVACAGIGTAGSLRLIDAENFDSHLRVNVTGAFNTIQACLTELAASKGYVLVLGSLAGIIAPPGLGAYGVSKAAVESLADAWQRELRFLGIDVGVAYLSWVDTDMVRVAETQSSAFVEMRRGLPWPLTRTMTVEQAVTALVVGIDKNSRRIFQPGYLRAVFRCVVAGRGH